MLIISDFIVHLHFITTRRHNFYSINNLVLINIVGLYLPLFPICEIQSYIKQLLSRYTGQNILNTDTDVLHTHMHTAENTLKLTFYYGNVILYVKLQVYDVTKTVTNICMHIYIIYL